MRQIRFLPLPTFKAPIPDRFFGRNELGLKALANGVFFAQASCQLRLNGNLDRISERSCAGWILSPDAPQRIFDIDVYRDGEFVSTVKASMPREDLRAKFPVSWRAGFEVVLPKRKHSQIAGITLSFRLHGSDFELFDGPYVLGDVPATVRALRKAAAFAHRRDIDLSWPSDR